MRRTPPMPLMTIPKGWIAALAVALGLGGCEPCNPPPPEAVAARDADGPRAEAGRRFERAKGTEPDLIAFLKRMPKGADLHNHVSGAVYSDFMLDSAIAAHLFYDPATTRFSEKETPGSVPAANLTTDERLLNGFRNAVSMRGWFPATESGHDHFFATFGIIRAADQRSVDDALVEVVRRNLAQNVQYLELMTEWAPDAPLEAVRKSAGNEAFESAVSTGDFPRALAMLAAPLKEVAASVPPFMAAREAALAKILGPELHVGGAGGAIDVRYIAQLKRLDPNPLFFAAAAAAMTGIAADRRVVALNMVQPEDEPNSRLHFKTQMLMLDFLWNHLGRPAITLHAGELVLHDSPVEEMRSRIRDSIVFGHARRIGHGVSVAWEDDLPGLLSMMKERGILVEICLTSNASILGVEGDRHPFGLYRRAGVPVCLNTDDEGVSRSNLTMEWVRAVHTYGLSYADLVEMARNSLEYSFLPGESLFAARDFAKRRPEFAGLEDPKWTPSPEAEALLGACEKMRLQVRLELALAAFERGEAAAAEPR